MVMREVFRSRPQGASPAWVEPGGCPDVLSYMGIRVALWAILAASLVFGAAGVAGALDRVPPSPTPPPPCRPIPLGAPTGGASFPTCCPPGKPMPQQDIAIRPCPPPILQPGG